MPKAADTPTPFLRPSQPEDAGTVVPFRPKETVESIIESVRAKRDRKDQAILNALRDMTASLEGRKAITLAELGLLGRAMDYPTLLDWIEIGRRMAGLAARR